MQPGTNATSTSDETRTTEPTTDWAAIEREFRIGVRANIALAATYGVSEGAIRKRAKKESWTKDLSAKVKAKADELVRKQTVRAEVRKDQRVSENREVEIAAHQQMAIRLGQRQDIQRSRGIAMALMHELQAQAGTENAALLAQLGELMSKPDEKGIDKLNDLYQKVISLPGRAKTMKDLGESLRVLVALERQAFGIDDNADSGTGAQSFLEAMLEARARV